MFSLNNFQNKIILTAFIFLMSSVALTTSFFPKFLHIALFVSIIYFPVASIYFHNVILNQIKLHPQRFVAIFIGKNSLKLLSYLILLVVLLIIFKPLAIPVAILFLLQYFVYTIIELIDMNVKLKETKTTKNK